MVSLTQLEYLVAVDRHRHFGKAAKACFVTQPSLSMQIQKAEEELGVTIFDRDKKPVLPTDKGAKLIEQAKTVLREHAKLLQMSRDEAGAISGDFTLGVIPTLAPYLVPLFVETFTSAYPRVRLTIEELKTEEIIRALAGDALDAGLLATPLNERGLRERVLFYEPFYLYLSSGSPLAAKRRVSVGDLDGREIWLLRDGHCFRNQVVSYCGLSEPEEPMLRSVRFESGNFETLRNLIRNGRGYTLFPHLFVVNLTPDERAASVRPLTAPVPTREISLVHRRDNWKSDIIEALEGAVRDALPAELKRLDDKKMQVLGIDP